VFFVLSDGLLFRLSSQPPLQFRRQFAVGLRAFGFGIVHQRGHAVAGCLGQPHVARDGGGEEFAAEVLLQLFADFRRHERAVLLATSSFWEGVDVRGDRLVCVVIDKLPFAAPNDPVTRARHRLLEDKGLSPFMHDTLPQAIITLKQGVGRLIRDSGDYGVLVLADPRLTQKNYGQTFLNSLPPMTKTRKIEVIDRFFAYHETTKTA